MANLSLNKQSLTTNVAKTETLTVITDNSTFTAQGDQFVEATANVAKKTIAVKGIKQGKGKVIATINYKETVESKGELVTVPYSTGITVEANSYVTHENKTYKATEKIETTTDWATDSVKFTEIIDIEAEKPTISTQEDRTKTAECVVTVNAQLVTQLTVTKETVNVREGKTDTITVTTNADSFNVTKDNNNVDFVKKQNNIEISGVKKGNSIITVEAQAADSVKSTKKINVTIEERLMTELSLNKQTLALKVGESEKLTVTTNAAAFAATGDDKIKVTPDIAKKTINVEAVKEGNSTLTVKAKNGDDAEKTVTCTVAITAKVVPPPPSKPEGSTPSKNNNENLPNFRTCEKFGRKNLPSEEEAMKDYLNKVQSYTNGSNIKLNTMLKVTVVDKVATGTYTKSLFCKEIISLIIDNKIGNVKFINDARATSFIAFVRDLTQKDYGSVINDAAKCKIIRYVADGHGIEI